jgi:hypothetical protein
MKEVRSHLFFVSRRAFVAHPVVIICGYQFPYWKHAARSFRRLGLEGVIKFTIRRVSGIESIGDFLTVCLFY